MTNGERRRSRGTPSSHLSDHLGLISQFTEQAPVRLEKESDTARIFMAVYSGFLVEAGAGIRWLLEPSLIEQATVAVRRQAPTATGAERALATRLLATLWTAGVVAGVDTEDWIRDAPELPVICLRMAAQVVNEVES
ncbi:hypothetical protein QF037_008923 [Streptomyces canus]|uniref:hypothetical protein n=1 Tax=Streptomyces canus TaxID=58343 RepID=UPI002786578C|nr:hypothetical protein [Streptomyces canus]MDQ0604578.1 hypothetical protein [Streptomyces canus]